MTNSL